VSAQSRVTWRDVPFEIAVHNGEEDLEEQVDGIYQHSEEV
jgi:hypothetical protein